MSDTPCLIDLQLDLPMRAAELAPPQPLLDLVPRLPEAIDAALIPILVGPPGPAGATGPQGPAGPIPELASDPLAYYILAKN